MKRRKVLQASFNLDDPFEADLLAYVRTQGDVSKYIKRLIYVDKEGFRSSGKPAEVQSVETDVLREAMNSVSL